MNECGWKGSWMTDQEILTLFTWYQRTILGFSEGMTSINYSFRKI